MRPATSATARAIPIQPPMRSAVLTPFHAKSQKKSLPRPPMAPAFAAALDPQELPVLGAGRNLERDRALRRRNVDLAAERGRREGDRHLHDEVVSAALVRRRRLDPCDDDQVAVRAAMLAGLALALEP